MQKLRELNLSNNSLDGEIPMTLQSCRRLQSLDLSRNRLSGPLSWLVSIDADGYNMRRLALVHVQDNKFFEGEGEKRRLREEIKEILERHSQRLTDEGRRLEIRV